MTRLRRRPDQEEFGVRQLYRRKHPLAEIRKQNLLQFVAARDKQLCGRSRSAGIHLLLLLLPLLLLLLRLLRLLRLLLRSSWWTCVGGLGAQHLSVTAEIVAQHTTTTTPLLLRLSVILPP